MTDYRVIVCGTGRSGTKWCATVFRLAGYRVGHEQVFTTSQLPRRDPQTWDGFEGDCSLAAVPFLARHHECRRILVVRHPYDFAASWVTNSPFLADAAPPALTAYLADHHPAVMAARTETEAGLAYWLGWNDTAISNVDAVLRLEEITPAVLLDAAEWGSRWPLFPFDEPINSRAPADRDVLELERVDDETMVDVADLATAFGYDPL